ncbi:hypothetical protein ZWY2020_018307 [Hordeum vulgare]|nr:hypothetical protein ZWY2020_018307 [Hordeum vulgare]
MLGIQRATTEEERMRNLDALAMAVRPLEDAFGACSGGKAFFADDSVGYLNLALGIIPTALGCHLFWFEALREMFGVMVIDAGRTPRLAAWAGRFLETETTKKAASPIESIVEYVGPCFFHADEMRVLGEEEGESRTARPQRRRTRCCRGSGYLESSPMRSRQRRPRAASSSARRKTKPGRGRELGCGAATENAGPQTVMTAPHHLLGTDDVGTAG